MSLSNFFSNSLRLAASSSCAYMYINESVCLCTFDGGGVGFLTGEVSGDVTTPDVSEGSLSDTPTHIMA